MASLFVGIDYGTSSSKIVVNDQDAPGGAYLFPLVGPDGSARIPSGIRRTNMGIELGQLSTPATASEVYDSVKMRLAAKAGLQVTGPAFYEDGLDPSGWTDEELAVVSVAWLQHLAMRAPRRSDGEAKYQFLVGVPASFREVPSLQRTFVNVARAAAIVRQELPELPAKIGTGSPQHFAVRRAIEETNARYRGHVDDEEFDDWLQTETAAATKWLVACNPSIRGRGRPWILTDIGAGTVNLSALLFRPAEDEDLGTSILAACSGHTAVNAVAVAAHNLGFSMADSRAVGDALKHTTGLRDALRAPLHVLFARIQAKNSNVGRAWDQWAREACIIGIGGGSRLGNGQLLKVFQAGVPYRDVTHPIETLRGLRPPDLKTPPNFRADELLNLAVAYGLAHPAGDGHSEWGPDRIKPIEHESGLRARCQCGGANESCARCGGSGFMAQSVESYAARIASFIGPAKEPKRSKAATAAIPQIVSVPTKAQLVPPLPAAVRPPVPVQRKRRSLPPMGQNERKHFGKNLELVAQLEATIRQFSNRGIRKPSDISYELNASGSRTKANEPWTPRLAALLLNELFNGDRPGATIGPGTQSTSKPGRERPAVHVAGALAHANKPQGSADPPRTWTGDEQSQRRETRASEPPKPLSQDAVDAWITRYTGKR